MVIKNKAYSSYKSKREEKGGIFPKKKTSKITNKSAMVPFDFVGKGTTTKIKKGRIQSTSKPFSAKYGSKKASKYGL